VLHLNVKMHQILFWLVLRPKPRWGSLQRSPDLLAGFKGPTSKERDGREGRGGKQKKSGKRRKKRSTADRGRGKEREGKGNLLPLKFRSGYATGHVK